QAAGAMHADEAPSHGARRRVEREPLASAELFRSIKQQEVRGAQGADAGEQGLLFGNGAFRADANQVRRESSCPDPRDKLLEQRRLARAMRPDYRAAPFRRGAAVEKSVPRQTGGKPEG